MENMENNDNSSVSEDRVKEKRIRVSDVFDILETVAIILCITIIVCTFFFRNAVVHQTSMNNTLSPGDRLIVTDLFYEPKYGDIVVFQDNSTGFDYPLIKRVIAVAGQHIEYTDGVLKIDGEIVEEDYVYCDYEDRHGNIDLTVPENSIFVMGDHRNVSSDSRTFGCVTVDSVIGHVILRVYPFSKFGTVD